MRWSCLKCQGYEFEKFAMAVMARSVERLELSVVLMTIDERGASSLFVQLLRPESKFTS